MVKVAGLAIAGGLGLAIGVVAGFAYGGLSRGGGGPPPPPNCPPGYYRCASGACCPNADFCACPDGSCNCNAGAARDQQNPGCCISACPPSCSADSQCSACGPGFVCENGQCQKQLPSSLSSTTLSTNIPFHFDYLSTGCFLIGCYACHKCNPHLTGGSVAFIVRVNDQTGRGVPGVALSIATSLYPGLAWEAITNFGTPQAMTYTSNPVPTGFDGSLRVILTSDNTLPSNYGSAVNSIYPCDACGGQGQTGAFGVSLGTLSISAPGFPSLGNLPVLIGAQVNWSEGINNGYGGCACL